MKVGSALRLDSSFLDALEGDDGEETAETETAWKAASDCKEE